MRPEGTLTAGDATGKAGKGPVCDLLIRTYWRDLEWLQLCLRSIDTYCRGFRETIVLIPKSSSGWLRRIDLLSHIQVLTTNDVSDDYLGQQVSKLHADIVTDADFICHVDADCMFARPTTPTDLLSGQRPFIAIRSLDQLGRHYPWRLPSERFLGWRLSYDFMQEQPFTYPRWLYPLLRTHARRLHGVDLATYVLSQPPRGFSEFNVLGAFAWQHFRDEFAWRRLEDEPTPDPRCRWYWSWGGLTRPIRREIEALLEPQHDNYDDRP